jgi:Holliday junction resolvasome RuvABC DNA-binding subunit
MDNKEPKDKEVVVSDELFWRQFSKNIRLLMSRKIDKKRFVENLLNLGYTEKQLSDIVARKRKNERTNRGAD